MDVHALLIGMFSFVYVFISFGVTGVPGISRISLVAGVAILALLLPVSKRLKYGMWLLPVLSLAAYGVFMSVGVGDKEEAYGRLAQLLTVCIGTTAFGLAFQNGYITYRTFVYAALLAAVANLAADLMGFDSYEVYSGEAAPDRASGLTGNANSLALLLVFTSVFVWMREDLFPAVVKILTLPFLIAAVQTTGSRKGLVLAAPAVAFICERFFMSAILNRRKFQIAAAFMFAVLAVLLLAGFGDRIFSGNLAMERMQRGLGGDEASFEGRVGYVESGLKLFSESPIVGRGMGQFASLSGFGLYSHNNIVELLVSGGIVALCIYYSLHLIIIANILRSKRKWTYFFILGCLLITDMGCVTYNNKMLSAMLVVLYLLAHEAKTDQDAGTNVEGGTRVAPAIRGR